MKTRVQLRAAKIPFVGWLAVHYWYVIFEGETTQRWEVWQNRERAAESWGHLHKNLLPPNAGVGNGASWLDYQWSGSEAIALCRVIEASPNTYPHTHCYRYWPGPNSNTYVQWVLQQAQINHGLSWKGVGKSYGGNIFLV
ncbi:MAG: DUF3750 domain-containing protein [Synechocystis sp.]|jgi:hypothetical protein